MDNFCEISRVQVVLLYGFQFARYVCFRQQVLPKILSKMKIWAYFVDHSSDVFCHPTVTPSWAPDS